MDDVVYINLNGFKKRKLNRPIIRKDVVRLMFSEFNKELENIYGVNRLKKPLIKKSIRTIAFLRNEKLKIEQMKKDLLEYKQSLLDEQEEDLEMGL